MDRLRLFLSRWVFSPLQGTTFRTWRRALRENHYAIAPAFWPRALLTTLSAAATSRAARREQREYGDRIAAVRVPDPLFILGHYRSGTTHLHNLLAIDPGHLFVNNYQASFPRTFLTTEGVGSRLGSVLTMRKRPHDNVELDLRVPTEDELALCADTLLSPHMAWHFPHRAPWYDERYLTFESATDEERTRWVESLRTLARKLVVKYGPLRPVFKSPLHTARIPMLLEAFPDARFVHVHRDPYAVFQSTQNMEGKVEPLFRYQFGDPGALEEKILRRYRRMYDAYFRDRAHIAPERLVEVAYESLDREPLETLAGIYRDLGLGGFEQARPAIESYLQTIADYEKNRYPPMPPELRARIADRWRETFDRWGYPR